MSHAPEGKPGTVRPGGRTARTRTAVLAATRAELTDTGLARMTVEKVAARAGVAKTTVYARWRDISGLIVDLLSELTVRTVPVPDTGSLEEDLRQLARSLLELFRSTEDLVMFEAIFATALHDREARRPSPPSTPSGWTPAPHSSTAPRPAAKSRPAPTGWR